METSFDLPTIRIITISGRIASGSTTLAKGLAQTLGWRHLEGGEIFWEAFREKAGLDTKDTHLRPDLADEEFDNYLKKVLKEQNHLILETKLAGFNAQGIDGIYKILVMCEGPNGEDHTDIRIDRLVNREGKSVERAKEEVLSREKNDLEKWQRMYASGDPNWKYWDSKYYDLVINTYSHNQEEALQFALQNIGKKD